MENNRYINEKAERLYNDVIRAERELNSTLEHSMSLADLEEIRSIQTEINYRLDLFNQYIESLEVQTWKH